MDSHTLELLGVSKIRALVAARAACSLGKEAARGLEPSGDVREIHARQAVATEMVEAIRSGLRTPLGGLHDIRPLVRRAHVGAMLEAEELADEVAIIDGGRVIAHGSPAALCQGGAADTLRFGGPPALDLTSLKAALPAGSDVSEPVPGSYRVSGEIDPRLLATVTAWCAQHGVMPDRITTRRHTLEDVFLELTGKELRS